MKVFQSLVTTFLDGKEIFHISISRIMQEKCPADKTIDVSWDNVDAVLKEYGATLPFSVNRGITGFGCRRIEFNSIWFVWRDDKPAPIKKKNTPVPDIQVKIEWTETSPPIKDILEWPEGDKAIQYLKERGLSLK